MTPDDLTQLRAAAGVTQSRLADLMNASFPDDPISWHTLRAYSKGERRIPPRRANQITRLLAERARPG